MTLPGLLGLVPQPVQDSSGASSPLTLTTNSVGIGVSEHPRARLHVIDRPSDPNGATFILGGTGGSNLRLGVHSDYSWIQSHGLRPLHINKLGNATIINMDGGNVGIGTNTPQAKLDIAGEVRAGRLTLTGLQCRSTEHDDVYPVVVTAEGELLFDQSTTLRELRDRVSSLSARLEMLEQRVASLLAAEAE